MRTPALLLLLAACTPAGAAEPVMEIRVGPVAALATPEDITSVAIMESYPPGFNIGVGPELAGEIAELTGAHIGEEARFSICGEVVARPVIRERIAGPNMAITPIPPKKVEGYLMALTGKAPCPAAE